MNQNAGGWGCCSSAILLRIMPFAFPCIAIARPLTLPPPSRSLLCSCWVSIATLLSSSFSHSSSQFVFLVSSLWLLIAPYHFFFFFLFRFNILSRFKSWKNHLKCRLAFKNPVEIKNLIFQIEHYTFVYCVEVQFSCGGLLYFSGSYIEREDVQNLVVQIDAVKFISLEKKAHACANRIAFTL